MEVRVIKSTEPKEPKKVNIPAAALLGGLGGYALKYTWPISNDDVKDFTNGDYLSIVRKRVAETKKAAVEEIAEIAKTKGATNAEDLFVHIANTKPGSPERIKHLSAFRSCSNEFKTKVRDIAASVGRKMAATSKAERYVLDAAIKDSRSASVFVVPGIIIGLVSGFVFNIIGKLRQED